MAKSYQRPAYPTRLTLDIHSYCNASCVMCPYSRIANELPMGKMPWELYEKIINDFGALCKKHDFRGRLGYCVVAEPFVEKKILDYVKLALKQNLRLNFTTNADLLPPAMVDGLIELGFDGQFKLSCHGITPGTVRRIMKLDVERMLANIDYLIAHYPKERIQVTAIHVDWPAGERAKVLDYWKQRGISVHSPLPGSRAGSLECFSRRPLPRLAGCKSDRPLKHLTVTFNGDVTLCCLDMMRRVIVGNLREQTIDEVWNGERFGVVVDQVYGLLPSADDFICKKCEAAMARRGTPERLMREVRRNIGKARRFLGERRRR